MENQVEIYTTKDNDTAVEVRFDQETVWLNQDQLAELFQRDQSVISRHLNKIFKEDELDKKSNMQKMHIANSDCCTIMITRPWTIKAILKPR